MKSKAAPEMRSGWGIFRGITDDSKVLVVPTQSGQLQTIWPNCTVLPPYVLGPLEKQMPTVWHPGPSQAIETKNTIINLLADYDEYQGALNALRKMTEQRSVTIFNDPRAILMTRRDRISEVLAGVPGLTAPKCVRFFADHPDKFRRVFSSNGFDYPVLVRPARSQTGQHLVRVEHDGDWDKVHTIPWGGTHVYMTQFVDSKDPTTGRYAKIRIAIVEGKFVIRHVHFGQEWLVHFVPRDEARRRIEVELLDKLNNSDALKNIVAEIVRRVPLDYWGVDLGFSFQNDADFVLFEGNAAMSMLPQSLDAREESRQPEHIRVQTRVVARTLADMLIAHINAPDKWAFNKANLAAPAL